MDLNIKSKVAIITGGSRGIGQACAIELAKEGVKIVIAAQSEKNLKNATNIIQEYTDDCIYVSADLSKEQGCNDVTNQAIQAFGTVDILINNVGAANEENVLTLNRKNIERAKSL